MSELVFRPHSEKQDRAIFSEAKIVAVLAGIQWGKSRVGAVRSKRAMATYTDPEDSFIITAPTYKIMQQSTLPAFLGIMEGFGEYNKTDAIFRIHGGGQCYFRTETDPDSVVGITNVRHIWGDEAGKYGLYFWENLQARASFRDCPITLTSSIYSMNWVYRELAKPFMEGKRKDVEVISARSDENPYFPRREYERVKSTMDPRRFAMMYGAEFGQMAGLVYDCWDDDQNYIDPFDLPSGTRFFGGIDWGYYPDPFALKIRAITPDGHSFGVSEFVKTKQTITDIIQIARQKKNTFKVERFFCDPSQPGHIEELNRNGIPASGADNDIRRGIDLHYELIKTRKYKEFRGLCPYSADERQSYHYPDPVDLKPDQNSKELLPVDKDNHLMDVDRYLTLETYRSEIKHTPKAPAEIKTDQTRLEFLKRSRSNKHSERWG